ncbi:hypothetical protein [Nocardia brasiliensis]
MPKTLPGWQSDFDICSAAQVLESIVLFDRIQVPDIDGARHTELLEITEALGDSLEVGEVPDLERTEAVQNSKDWLSKIPDAVSLIEVIGGTHTYSTESVTQLILRAYGVEDKYSTELRELMVTLGLRDTVNQHRSAALRYAEPLKRALEAIGLPMIRINRVPSSQACVHEDIVNLCTSLAWAAYRVRLYGYLASAQGIPYMPHPMRSRVSGFAAATDIGGAEAATDPGFARAYIEVLERVYEEARATVNESLGTAMVPLTFSPLLPYIAKKAGRNRNDLLAAAYDVRDSKGAKAVRAATRNLQDAMRNASLHDTMKSINELQALAREFRTGLGLNSPQQIATAISVAGFRVDAPITLSPKASRGVKRISTPFSPRTALFLRNVFADLSQVAALGEVYDIFFDLPEN